MRGEGSGYHANTAGRSCFRGTFLEIPGVHWHPARQPGALVALAVDGWREDPAERELEREYLERLIIDVRTGRDRLDSLVEIHLKAAERNMETVAPFFCHGDAIPFDTVSFFAALFQSARSVVLDLAETYPKTTFEELRSTGGFVLIRDPELRSALIADSENLIRLLESALQT